MRLFKSIGVVAAIITMLIPAISSAQLGSELNTTVQAHISADTKSNVSERDDNHQNDDKDHSDRDLRSGKFIKMFARGTVSALTSSGFVIKAKDGTSFTVNAAASKLIRLPRATIALTDIKVGDRVWVQGTKTDNIIAATTVYDISADTKAAIEKGKVTAISGNNITLQTKNNANFTVITDSNTQVKQGGQAATSADIKVGTDVKVFGLWNKITNFFQAVMVSIK